MLTLQILKLLYSHHISKNPKNKSSVCTGKRSSDLAWVYVTEDLKKIYSMRTLLTLRKNVEKDWYITPNGFYHSQDRRKETIRYINAIVLDFDEINLFEAEEKIFDAGLPKPTFWVNTPSGGCHAWWVLDKPIRSGRNQKARVLVEAIQRTMALASGADMGAIGAERFYRVPHQERLYVPEIPLKTTSLDTLLEWREINYPEYLPQNQENVAATKYVFSQGDNFLNQPFFQHLLKGVEDGQRNHACYTLALAFKFQHISEKEALDKLTLWDRKNIPALGLARLKIITKSAYRCKSQGPKRQRVKDIFGWTFKYRSWVPTPAKPRIERQRVHIKEWAEDILYLLEAQGGQWKGSQRELAERLHASKRSIEEALKWLVSHDKINLNVFGKGRGAKTHINLITPVQEAIKPVEIAFSQVAAGAEQLHDLIPHTHNIPQLMGVVGRRSFFFSWGSPFG